MEKYIVVTGATSGVGKKIVERFAQLNWKVVGIARDIHKLKKLESKFCDRFIPIVCDLQNANDVAISFKQIKDITIHIDILVNNAAVFKKMEFINCSVSDIDSIVNTNLKGVMYTTLEALKLMKDSIYGDRGARIVNIASVASIHGISQQAIYCASKFGLTGFSEALNQEIIKDNISITTIYPGGINTPLWNSTNPYPGGDVKNILDVTDIVDLIEYISNLKPRIILKNITLFPSNEWH